MYDYERCPRVAMDHATPEAKKKYLREHPKADPKNHSVSKAKNTGGGASSRKQEADRLIEEYAKKPGLERKITKLKDTASELEKLEERYSNLGPDDHYTMQRKLEETFDEYAKLLDYCTGVTLKKPWYYDR